MKYEKRLFYALLLLLTIGLSLYSYMQLQLRKEFEPTLDNILRNPEKYHGKIGQLKGTFINQTGNFFFLRVYDMNIRFFCNGCVIEPKAGALSVLARSNREGFFEVISIHYHYYENFKYALSFFAFLWFLYFFFMEWKLTWRGFEENA